MRWLNIVVVLMMVLVGAVAVQAQDDVVELRMTWYSDGNEGEVMRDLLDRFEAENPDIVVVIDEVAYSTGILENLPIQLAAGEGPDIARVTDLGGLSEYYLDIGPLVEDPQYYEDNFGPFLTWLRPPGNTDGIFGIQNQLTVTGPFINRTLFEQAGVEVPSDVSDEVTWEEWAEAASAVAEATGTTAMAMDRSGHRLAGPAISLGAQYFDADGNPVIAGDEGFRSMAQLMIDWHENGIMSPEIWVGNAGQYAAANEQFVNGELVFYMSGSWQIGQFDNLIGDAFDWEAVPNPCGPGGCTGMPGGAATVAINQTEHPEEVARVIDFLAAEENLREFHERTLFIPAHAGIASSGLDFQTDNPLAAAALNQFSLAATQLSPIAVDLQAYPFNRVVFDSTRDRLTQAIVGELTLDEAIERMQQDIDEALAAVSE